MTDSHGRKVDFRNVICIMTSNLGAQVIANLPEQMRGSEPQAVESIMDIVRHTLSPELLNRIDETVVFNRLQRENMDTICEIGLKEIAERLEDGQNMKLDVSDSAKQVLAEMGYDVRYGARPLKRTLARQVLNPLSRLVLEGSLLEGDVVKVRTRYEAEREQKQLEESGSPSATLGWLSSNVGSNDKNDVVLVRNHEPVEDEDESDSDDDEYYMEEDGKHVVHH